MRSRQEKEQIRDRLKLLLTFVGRRLFLSPETIKGKGRDKNTIAGRIVFTLVALKLKKENKVLNITFAEIGEVINRDHATILHTKTSTSVTDDHRAVAKAVEGDLKEAGFWKFNIPKKSLDLSMYDTLAKLLKDPSIKEEYKQAVRRASFLLKNEGII